MNELFIIVVGDTVYLSTEIVEITRIALNTNRLGHSESAGFVPYEVPLQEIKLTIKRP